MSIQLFSVGEYQMPSPNFKAPNDVSDHPLLLKWINLKSGDRSDFEQLYKHYLPYTESILYRVGLRNREDRKEAVQEVWIRVWRAVRKVRTTELSGFVAWLGRITRNVAYSHLRRAQRSPLTKALPITNDAKANDLVEEWFEIDDLAAAEPTENDLISRIDDRRRFAGFSELDRTIFILRQRYTQKQIAEIVGLRQGEVSIRLRKMRNRLRIN